jgi:hypothetical protein
MQKMMKTLSHSNFLPTGKRQFSTLALLAALSGCAQISQSPTPALRYVCENDQSFFLTIAPTNDKASVEINRMHFTLDAEPAEGSEERYGCSQMIILRNGEQARFSMDAAQHFTHCQLQKP